MAATVTRPPALTAQKVRSFEILTRNARNECPLCAERDAPHVCYPPPAIATLHENIHTYGKDEALLTTSRPALATFDFRLLRLFYRTYVPAPRDGTASDANLMSPCSGPTGYRPEHQTTFREFIESYLATGLHRLRRVTFALMLISASSASSTPSLSDIDNYLENRMGERRALVIGNANYASLPKLPGVTNDITIISDKLRDLNFEVTPHGDINTSPDFQRNALVEFRRAVKQDDLVIVYLSGHGFSYGGYNYFAFTNTPTVLPESEINKFAVPVEVLADFFADHQPAAVLILVDACRNIGDFIKNDQNTLLKSASVASAGSNMPRLETSFLVGYAAKPGSPAIADSVNPSIYTKHLVAHLGTADKIFDLMHRDVAVDVEEETGFGQSPGTLDWLRTDIFLNPRDATIAQYREQWIANFNTQDPKVIRRFMRRQALNPYIVSARQWLDDYHQQDANHTVLSYTRYSPILVNEAWDASNTSSNSVLMSSLDPEFPIAFNRYANLESEVNDPPTSVLTEELISTNSDGWGDSNYQSRLRNARTLLANRAVVVTETVKAKIKPFSESPTSVELEPNQEIVAEAVVSDPKDEKIWLKFRTLKENTLGFLALSQTSEGNNDDSYFGRAVTEFKVEPNSNGLRSLINKAALEEHIHQLRNRGVNITWIALSTSLPDSASASEAENAHQRLIHARYVLSQIGVDTKIITTSTMNISVGEDTTTKVRVFGYTRN